MKKHLFLSLLAVSLSLVACGKNKEPAGPVDPLTPEQRENATKTNTIIYDLVKEDFSEEIAEATKSYIAENAEHAASKGVRSSKVESYIADAKKLDKTASAIFEFGKDIYDDEGVNDAVYFGVALGKCYLKASTLYDLADSGYYTFALTEVEKEGDSIAENVIPVVNSVYSAADDVSAIMVSKEFSGILMSIMTQEVLVPANVKALLKDASDLVKKFVGVKENVKYFGEFAKRVLVDLPNLSPDVPKEVVDFIEALEVGAAIESIFEVIDSFGTKLASLPDAYYTHLGEIELPYESYAYAVFGAVKYLLPEVETTDLTPEEIEAVSDTIVEAALDVLELLKDYIGSYQGIIAEFIENPDVKDIISGLIKFAQDASKYESKVVSVESVCHIIGVIFDELKSSTDYEYINAESLEEFKEKVAEFPEGVKVDTSKLEEAIENREEYTPDIANGYCETNPVDSEVEGYKAFDTIEYQYLFQYVPGETEESDYFYSYVSCTITTVEYSNLKEVAQYIYDVLDEVVKADDYRNALVDDLRAIGLSVSSVLDYYIALMSEDSEQGAQLEAIQLVIDGICKTDAPIALVKAALKDVVVVLRNLMGAFIGENPKSSFGQLVAIVAYRDMSDMNNVLGVASSFLQKYQESEVTCIGSLLEEVYGIAVAAGYNMQMVNALADEIEKVTLLSFMINTTELRAADTAEKFRTILFDNFIKLLLVEAE